MPTRTRTKRRTLKPDETRNLDLCTCCFSYHCDPMSMSEAFRHKISERLRKHLCPACGKPKAFCSCKSSMDPAKAGAFRKSGGNKALRRAQQLIQDKENAYLWFRRQDERLPAVIGQDVYSDVLYDLYQHQVPDVPFEQIAKPMRAAGIDPSPLLPGWKPVA